MKLAINLATTREQWSFREAAEGYARHGIAGIAPWRDQVAECGLAAAARLVRELGLVVTGYSRGGLFSGAGPAGLRAAVDENRRAIDEAAELGALCIEIVAGGLAPDSKDIAGARGLIEDGLAALLPYARAAGVALAIEPLHPMYAADRSAVNLLAQALDLCDRLDPDRDGGLGVAVDVYHVWWDPALEAQISRAGKDRLLAFHISDWLVPTRDLLLDRGMMGDGIIDLARIRGWMESAGFSGMPTVEIFSRDDWWRRDPDEVVATCIERFKTCC